MYVWVWLGWERCIDGQDGDGVCVSLCGGVSNCKLTCFLLLLFFIGKLHVVYFSLVG